VCANSAWSGVLSLLLGGGVGARSGLTYPSTSTPDALTEWHLLVTYRLIGSHVRMQLGLSQLPSDGIMIDICKIMLCHYTHTARGTLPHHMFLSPSPMCSSHS
jgi:hypothetical protein